jgi:hypothetical protein
MVESVDGPPVVSLPERMDRRLRLGPFPSARAAVSFLVYAAVGSGIAAGISPLLGLGVIAGGLAVSVLRYDGDGLHRRGIAIARYWLGGVPRRIRPVVTGSTRLAGRGFLDEASGRFCSVVRAGGAPMAYLPPPDIAARFDRFRELLRAHEGDLALRVTLAPMRAAPVLPSTPRSEGPDRLARDGYVALVRLLCARRSTRRVDLLLRSDRSGAEGVAQLETRVTSLVERLTGLGVPARRLVGRSLIDAVSRLTEHASRSDP